MRIPELAQCTVKNTDEENGKSQKFQWRNHDDFGWVRGKSQENW